MKVIMFELEVRAMVMEVIDIFYKIETVMQVIDVMAMVMEVMDIVIGLNCNKCDRRDGDGDGHCYKIEAAMHVINVMAMVMDVVIGLKL